ncbi:hypothetical protein CFP56_039639 [Quercus suber]|uniref:Uncharacterized protein n=1 Tax=Quercus suber TaxID=58331 RepID=A0AAW0M9P0_QUESU
MTNDDFEMFLFLRLALNGQGSGHQCLYTSSDLTCESLYPQLEISFTLTPVQGPCLCVLGKRPNFFCHYHPIHQQRNKQALASYANPRNLCIDSDLSIDHLCKDSKIKVRTAVKQELEAGPLPISPVSNLPHTSGSSHSQTDIAEIVPVLDTVYSSLPLRRSQRVHKPPTYLKSYKCSSVNFYGKSGDAQIYSMKKGGDLPRQRANVKPMMLHMDVRMEIWDLNF